MHNKVMRNNHIIDEVLGQKGKVKILRCLIFSSGNLTAREIARRVGFTPWACIKSLRELETLGLIKMEKSGRSNLYTINRKNFIVMKMLLPLFEKEKNFLKWTIDWIVKKIKFKPVSIILFGSFARGEEERRSDIDLCILVKQSLEITKLEEEMLKIAPIFYEKFGKKLASYISDIGSFKIKYEKGMTMFREIVRDGIILYGDPISKLMK